MNGILIQSLYIMSGFCAFAAIHHSLAAVRRRVNRLHILFALASITTAGLIMARAGAYGAETAYELVAMRRWEITSFCLFAISYLWFIADYTGIRPRKLLLSLSAFFVLLLAVNLDQPYGIQFVDLPHLTYFHLPWGERVVDLRVLQRGFWHNMMWLGIFVCMGYGVYACYAQCRKGNRGKARALAWAQGVFFTFSLFNIVVNQELIEFIHTSDFGFVGLIVLMDLEMMLESRDQNRRMCDVLDHLPAAICLKNLKGHYLIINRTFHSFFGVNPDDIHNKTDVNVFSEEHSECFRANEVLAIEKRQEVESEYILEPDGKQHIFKLRQFPLLRPDGTVFGVCCVHIDVTEERLKDKSLQNLRHQVWRSDRVANTGAITSSLAHELCQPLSAILNNAQAGLRFLAQDKIDFEEMHDLLEDIVRDDKRAGGVINGLRAMLQQQEIPYAFLDVARCIEEILDLLHSEFIRLGVEVESKLEARLTVRANKTQIQQVVLNLAINALEAMAERSPSQRVLRVKMTHADGKVYVSIRDTGIGIPEDKLERVFDGFYTTKPQGLGVGLEVCRSIIQSHRGAIWAEANPEYGVTFHFTLPLIDDQDGADTASSHDLAEI